MTDVENDKIISWRKINDNNTKNISNKNRIAIKEYSNKEKEYLNKYFNISKNVLNEEQLYNIIIKFNFNEQLIVSEIFQLLEEASEKEKDENKMSNVINNKSTFIPYKTQFGIIKTVYNLDKTQNRKKKNFI